MPFLDVDADRRTNPALYAIPVRLPPFKLMQ
jgi:hypothetical protein